MNDFMRSAVFALGRRLSLAGEQLVCIANDQETTDLRQGIFLRETYKHINDARLTHLSSLSIPLEGKTVLEVGAGIGLHTAFFEKRNCTITSTDGRQENVDEMKRRFPHRDIRLFNLLNFDSYAGFEKFDVIYCYGTLYHTPKPDEILQGLGSLCREMILLETCVSPGYHLDIHLTRESETIDQAIGIIGCRPTRAWIMDTLRKYYGYAYTTKTQPQHHDFDLDWQIPLKKQNHRAVFVGSKMPIDNLLLLSELPEFQEYE